MITLTILSMITAAVGVVAAARYGKGLPESLSAIVYRLPYRWQPAWSLWIWLMVGLIAKPLVEAMPHVWWMGLIAFSAIACLGLVGAIPLMSETRNNRGRKSLHYVMAMLGGLLSQICVLIINPWWLLAIVLPWIIYAVLVIKFYKISWVMDLEVALEGKGVLIIEIQAMIAVYGTLLLS